MAKPKCLHPFGTMLRGPEPASLLPLVQHQKPLTPHGTTEQAKSHSCAFLLWPQSSHPAFQVSFSIFLARCLVLGLGYDLTDVKLKRISSINASCLASTLAMTQVSLGRNYRTPTLTWDGSVNTYDGNIIILFNLLELSTSLYFISTLILENQSGCRKFKQFGGH